MLDHFRNTGKNRVYDSYTWHAHTPHVKKTLTLNIIEVCTILNERNINKFKYSNILNESFYLKKILAKKSAKHSVWWLRKWHHNSLLNSFSLKRGRRRDREAEAEERKIWDRPAFCCSWILAIEISKSDVCHKNNDKSQAL